MFIVINKMKTDQKIIKALIKSPDTNTISALSGEIGISRQGVFKVVKRLELERLLRLSKVGKGRTSIFVIKLNWQNPILEKQAAIILLDEAQKNQRWITNFIELEKNVKFTLIFGSVLTSPKEAKDIDLINVASDFITIDKIINATQKTQTKKIHALNLTEAEIREELAKGNPALTEAIKKGVVLFGHENFIKFIRGLNGS